MSSARTGTLARLRGAIERMEGAGIPHAAERVTLGHADADAVLQGGLARGAVHEVFAAEGRQTRPRRPVSSPAWPGAARCAGRWSGCGRISRAAESGALSMSGLAELGLDPRLHRDGARGRCRDAALRIAAGCAGLRCARRRGAGSLGPGAPARSRRQPQADAGGAGLRRHLRCCCGRRRSRQPSTAETRWIVRAARSPPAPAWGAWGAPVFDAQLVRNRHGPVGRWIMEWKCDECLFT